MGGPSVPPPPFLEPERYERGAFLGGGASGEVYSELDRTAGVLVAVKYVSLLKVSPVPRFERELRNAQIAAANNVPACARFLRAAMVYNFNGSPWGCAIVAEQCGDGSAKNELLHWLNREWTLARAAGERPSEAPLRAAFVQVLAAVAGLHKLGIAHRDLKARAAGHSQRASAAAAAFCIRSLRLRDALTRRALRAAGQRVPHAPAGLCTRRHRAVREADRPGLFQAPGPRLRCGQPAGNSLLHVSGGAFRDPRTTVGSARPRCRSCTLLPAAAHHCLCPLGAATLTQPHAAAAASRQVYNGRDVVVYDALKSDIWSLGILLLIMLRLQYPFAVAGVGSGKAPVEALLEHGQRLAASGDLRSVLEAQLRDTEEQRVVSAECMDFVRQCLRQVPADRPSADALMQHSWVVNGPQQQLVRRFGTGCCFRCRRSRACAAGARCARAGAAAE